MSELITELKEKTLVEENIIFDGKYYRYINHSAKLLTCGFGVRNGLLRNKNIIRFDNLAINSMRNRYNALWLLWNGSKQGQDK